MHLPYFSHKLCKTLVGSIEERLEIYKSDTAVIDNDTEGIFQSSIYLGTAPELSDTSSGGDAENAIRLHQWLKIQPFMAADERIWTCLCHSLFYDYTTTRWANKTLKNIRERFFMTGVGFTPRVSNSISRLWWGAQLTYDPKRADPYELTRVLFSLQDIQQSFMERAYCSCTPLLHTVLEVLGDSEEELKAATGRGDIVKKLAKQINVYGGTGLLEAIPEDRLKHVVKTRLSDLMTG